MVMGGSDPANEANQVLLLTTGGTIDKVYFDAKSDYQVGESVLDDVLKKAEVNMHYRLFSLMRKDSLELNDNDRYLIGDTIATSLESRIIVTHGTDTMTETANAVAKHLGNNSLHKTVVFTGSLAPARFSESDATFNIGMAFAAVQSLKPGIYIVMNGQVFDAARVRKDRDNNRFVSLES